MTEPQDNTRAVRPAESYRQGSADAVIIDDGSEYVVWKLTGTLKWFGLGREGRPSSLGVVSDQRMSHRLDGRGGSGGEPITLTLGVGQGARPLSWRSHQPLSVVDAKNA